MTKDSNIILRVDPKAKERIALAARSRGKNMSTFILDATMRQVVKVESQPEPRRAVGSGPCPTYLRAMCETAKAGGSTGDEAVGDDLLNLAATEPSWDVEEQEWSRRLRNIEKLLARRRRIVSEGPEVDAAVLACFEEYVPRCLRLIPARRRTALLRGVYERYWLGGMPS